MRLPWSRSVTVAPPLVLTPPPRAGMSVALDAAHVPPVGVAAPDAIWRIPEPPPGVLPATVKRTELAMDYNPTTQPLFNFAIQSIFSEGLSFLGYSYLAELSQRPEYRHGVETIAKAMTRKWIKITGCKDDDHRKEIEAEMDRLKVRQKFQRIAELDGYFGRAQLYVDVGSVSARGSVLSVTGAGIGQGKLRDLRVVEPFWTYPGRYNSSDPLAPDFYCPQEWYVQGQTIHASRMLTFVGRALPDILKPVYSFGGLARTQMAKPYVDNWLRARQSVSDLMHSFSTMVLSTDMSTVLQGGSGASLLNRVAMYNQYRDNRGAMVVNKETEELTNVAAPLGGLNDLLSSAQEQMAAIWKIPLVEYLGVTPAGLNASSEGEIETWHATIRSDQEHIFGDHLLTVLQLVQLNLYGEIDPNVGFEFNDLWTEDDASLATRRKTDADTDAVYINAGVLDPQEVRDRIAGDEGGLYHGLDLSAAAPGLPEPVPPGEEEPDDEHGPPSQDR